MEDKDPEKEAKGHCIHTCPTLPLCLQLWWQLECHWQSCGLTPLASWQWIETSRRICQSALSACPRSARLLSRGSFYSASAQVPPTQNPYLSLLRGQRKAGKRNEGKDGERGACIKVGHNPPLSPSSPAEVGQYFPTKGRQESIPHRCSCSP